MSGYQQDLFKKKAKLKPRHGKDKDESSEKKTKSTKVNYRKQYGKTKTEIIREGRDARRILWRESGEIAEKMFEVARQEDYAPFLKMFRDLKETPEMESLKLWLKVDGINYVDEVIELINKMVEQIEFIMNISVEEFLRERWTKFKCGYHDKLLYTCHADYVRSTNWVFISSLKRVFCKKCFVRKFGAGKANQTPLPDPQFVEGMNQKDWEKEVERHITITRKCVRNEDKQLFRLEILERKAKRYTQDDWDITKVEAKIGGARREVEKEIAAEKKKAYSKS